MLTIYKGDDTGGRLGKAVEIEITTAYDIADCTVVFSYQGVERRWTGIHSGDRREVFFSHNETAHMAVGVYNAVVLVVDASGKVRTLKNALPIKVTTSLAECYGAAGEIAQVSIGAAVSWAQIVGLPFEGASVELSTDDDVRAALGTIIEKLGGSVRGLAAALCAFLLAASASAYEPPRHNGTYTTNGVTYAQRGGLGAADYVVTNIDASAVGRVRSVNGMVGDVVIDAEGVGAVARDADYLAVSNAAMGAVQEEVDPSVPAWAKGETPPLPPDYATVSNRAMTALQSFTETDPRFTAWADVQTDADGIVYYSLGSGYAYKLRSSLSAKDLYSAEDITAISNGFAAADLSLASRLSLASLAATNYTDAAIGAAIANTNPTFSNAVLSVGLGIDTNTVAAINALVEAGDELPIGGAATVGGLLLALAAAVAALKRTKADASALRYAMPESVALVAENDAATLVCGDRGVTNATIASGFATLNLTFPAEVSGYVRDFYLRITVAAGESAPAISLPQGVTIENAGGAVPEIADGEASAAATTLVWFSETAPGVFTAKSETVKAVV